MEEKIGKDYVIVVCQKNVYPQFLKSLENECGQSGATKTILLNRAGWMRTCNKIQPIFSRYYRWVVDGSSTAGKAFNDDLQVGYTDLNYMEIGHYDFHDFNKRSTNTEVTPNDIYTDGVIVGILGIHEPQLSMHDFDDILQIDLLLSCRRSKTEFPMTTKRHSFPTINQDPASRLSETYANIHRKRRRSDTHDSHTKTCN